LTFSPAVIDFDVAALYIACLFQALAKCVEVALKREG
jgi:hypothetical protein